MMGLTRRQAQCLAAIRNHIQERGVAPSQRELVAVLGLSSLSNSHRLVVALEERGYIRRLKHRTRAIELVEGDASPGTLALVSAARTVIAAIIAEDEDGDSIKTVTVAASAIGELDLVLQEHFP